MVLTQALAVDGGGVEVAPGHRRRDPGHARAGGGLAQRDDGRLDGEVVPEGVGLAALGCVAFGLELAWDALGGGVRLAEGVPQDGPAALGDRVDRRPSAASLAGDAGGRDQSEALQRLDMTANRAVRNGCVEQRREDRGLDVRQPRGGRQGAELRGVQLRGDVGGLRAVRADERVERSDVVFQLVQIVAVRGAGKVANRDDDLPQASDRRAHGLRGRVRFRAGGGLVCVAEVLEKFGHPLDDRRGLRGPGELLQERPVRVPVALHQPLRGLDVLAKLVGDAVQFGGRRAVLDEGAHRLRRPCCLAGGGVQAVEHLGVNVGLGALGDHRGVLGHHGGDDIRDPRERPGVVVDELQRPRFAALRLVDQRERLDGLVEAVEARQVAGRHLLRGRTERVSQRRAVAKLCCGVRRRATFIDAHVVLGGRRRCPRGGLRRCLRGLLPAPGGRSGRLVPDVGDVRTVVVVADRVVVSEVPAVVFELRVDLVTSGLGGALAGDLAEILLRDLGGFAVDVLLALRACRGLRGAVQQLLRGGRASQFTHVLGVVRELVFLPRDVDVRPRGRQLLGRLHLHRVRREDGQPGRGAGLAQLP
ncbi:unannotated protein [freshwater metagenome]|uniref:Unannotated protein n=1 Tax=freshwater metagenome TaxID=449393 RepID=A0A6J7GN06_9ZZZZ